MIDFDILDAVDPEDDVHPIDFDATGIRIDPDWEPTETVDCGVCIYVDAVSKVTPILRMFTCDLFLQHL